MRFKGIFPLVFAVFAFASLSPSAAKCQEAASTPEQFFSSGVAAFQKGDLNSARTAFTSGLALDSNNAVLLFNLGLVEQRSGKNGLAIALWRKALVGAPEFKPARQAIQFTRSKLERSEIPHEVETWESLRDTVLEPFTFEKFLGLTAAFLLGSGFLFLRYIGARRRAILDERPLPAFPLLALCLGIGFVVFAMLSVLKSISDSELRGTIIAKKVEARALPAEDGTPLFDLFEGLEVIVRQTKDSWLQVTYPGGGTGWVSRASVFKTNDRVATPAVAPKSSDSKTK